MSKRIAFWITDTPPLPTSPVAPSPPVFNVVLPITPV